MSSEEQHYLETLGRGVAQELKGWSFDKATDTAIWLKSQDGMGMILWAGGVWREDLGSTTVEVSGTYDLNVTLLRGEGPKISMTTGKGPKAMARDIERRFLPKYVPLYLEKLKLHNKIMRDREARRKVLAYLAGEFGWITIEDKDGLIKRVQERDNYGQSGLDAHYTTTLEPEATRRWEVDITLKKLTVEQARQVAMALKEPVFPTKQLTLL